MALLILVFGTAWAQGWYLLAPWPPETNGVAYDIFAPLPKWQHWAAYDTAAACERARGSIAERADKEAAAAFFNLTHSPWVEQSVLEYDHRYSVSRQQQALVSRCVSAVDPRLRCWSMLRAEETAQTSCSFGRCASRAGAG
jgi:hypothetical protein